MIPFRWAQFGRIASVLMTCWLVTTCQIVVRAGPDSPPLYLAGFLLRLHLQSSGSSCCCQLCLIHTALLRLHLHPTSSQCCCQAMVALDSIQLLLAWNRLPPDYYATLICTACQLLLNPVGVCSRLANHTTRIMWQCQHLHENILIFSFTPYGVVNNIINYLYSS